MKVLLLFCLLCVFVATQAYHITGDSHEYNNDKDVKNSREVHLPINLNSKEINDADLFNSVEEHLHEDYNSKEIKDETHFDNDYNSKENNLYNSEKQNDHKSEEVEEAPLNLSKDVNEDSDEDLGSKGSSVRTKRQVAEHAIGLASDHSRPVGKIHPKVDLNVSGNNGRNYHAHGGIGAGAVVHRSKNDRHSIGVGVYADQHRGRFQGFRYKSKPNFGAGIGYKFKF
ncbi:UNVERIFIED_CONTAM: hypothetical protein RMT77_006060 [Armadillidium vulgare]